jgi:hypothetical protein
MAFPSTFTFPSLRCLMSLYFRIVDRYLLMVYLEHTIRPDIFAYFFLIYCKRILFRPAISTNYRRSLIIRCNFLQPIRRNHPSKFVVKRKVNPNRFSTLVFFFSFYLWFLLFPSLLYCVLYLLSFLISIYLYLMVLLDFLSELQQSYRLSLIWWKKELNDIIQNRWAKVTYSTRVIRMASQDYH